MLPTDVTGSSAHGWWAMICVLVVAGMIFLMAVFGYLFLYGVHPTFWTVPTERWWALRSRAPTAWPPCSSSTDAACSARRVDPVEPNCRYPILLPVHHRGAYRRLVQLGAPGIDPELTSQRCDVPCHAGAAGAAGRRGPADGPLPRRPYREGDW
jgi:hypothetical protein